MESNRCNELKVNLAIGQSDKTESSCSDKSVKLFDCPDFEICDSIREVLMRHGQPSVIGQSDFAESSCSNPFEFATCENDEFGNLIRDTFDEMSRNAEKAPQDLVDSLVRWTKWTAEFVVDGVRLFELSSNYLNKGLPIPKELRLPLKNKIKEYLAVSGITDKNSYDKFKTSHSGKTSDRIFPKYVMEFLIPVGDIITQEMLEEVGQILFGAS